MNEAESSRKARVLDRDPGSDGKYSIKSPWGRPQHLGGDPGPVHDENYEAERPRGFTEQEIRFKMMNPEFRNGAAMGDWTSWKFHPDV